jgi:hypothetical protein
MVSDATRFSILRIPVENKVDDSLLTTTKISSSRTSLYKTFSALSVKIIRKSHCSAPSFHNPLRNRQYAIFLVFEVIILNLCVWRHIVLKPPIRYVLVLRLLRHLYRNRYNLTVSHITLVKHRQGCYLGSLFFGNDWSKSSACLYQHECWRL